MSDTEAPAENDTGATETDSDTQDTPESVSDAQEPVQDETPEPEPEPALEPETEPEPEPDETEQEQAELAEHHRRETARLTYELDQAETELTEVTEHVRALELELARVEVAHALSVPEDLLAGCESRADMENHAAQLKQWRADNPIPPKPKRALFSGSQMTEPLARDAKDEAVRALRDEFSPR